MALRIDFAGASLPRVCTLPVNYRVVCLREAGGVLVLPHHELVFQVHMKRLVGWVFYHDNIDCRVLAFCLFLGHFQFQGDLCMKHCCFIIFVAFGSSSVVTVSIQIPAFI